MKNLMKVVIMAIVLLTTTSCGVLDAPYSVPAWQKATYRYDKT